MKGSGKMEYKNCLFFKIEDGIQIQLGKDHNRQEIILKEHYAIVKAKSGNISFVRDYVINKENGIITELNRYYPSSKGKVLQ